MADNTASMTSGDLGSMDAGLGRLSELDDYQVAEGHPDIRGWSVKGRDGETIGKVGDLIVDTNAMRVRYVDIEIDRSVATLAQDAVTPGDQESHTLLPIGSVELDESHDDVLVDGYTLEHIAGLPRYDGQRIDTAYESNWRTKNSARMAAGAVAATAAGAAAAMTSPYDDSAYDDQRAYAKRRKSAAALLDTDTRSTEDTQRITLSEEQLSVGKRQVDGGEVALHKTVDTEHVTETVELRHEEVTVERRPIAPGAAPSAIEEGEIRIPIMEEQIVMTKVMVPREEIIVRKKQVSESETVQADVRKERLVTERVDQAGRTTTDSEQR